MTNVDKIIMTLTDIGEISSTNKKIEIFQDNKDFTELRTYLEYATNMTKPFYLNTLPVYTPVSNDEETIEELFVVLDALHNREVTGNAALEYVASVLNRHTARFAILLSYCLKKDTRTGAGRKLMSKVWPEFDTKEKLCKADSYSEKALKNINFSNGAYSELKMDGARCNILLFEDDTFSIRTSNGNSYTGIDHIAVELLSYAKNCMIDGEMIAVDEKEKPLPRKISNGIVTKSIKGTISEQEAKRIRFVVWDCISMDEYNGTATKRMKYSERRAVVQNIVRDCMYTYCVESKLVRTKQEAIDHFKEMLALGEEGTILKNVDFLWEPKRVHDCVKFKMEVSSTLKCIGMKNGKTGTKYEDCLGAIICINEDGLEVSVGTGFSDKQREELWHTHELINEYVEIVSNGLITNTNGEYSLFLPRFKCARPDKDEADSIAVIKKNMEACAL